MVELEARHARLMPAELSGGMVKRVALARALSLEPELLVLDEPTAGLDPDRSENFVKLLRMLQKELGFTVVMVTHDPETLAGLATRLAVLADQRLVACGTAAEVFAVDHPFIRNFFSSGRAAATPSDKERASHGESFACPDGRVVHPVSGFRGALSIWWFGGKHEATTEYTVVTRHNVTGLSLQGQVRYRGIRVGKVQAIELDPQDAHNILIRISVDSKVPVTRATTAKLGYQGVTGIAHILLEDSGNDPTRLAGGKDSPRIEMRSSLIEELSDSGAATSARRGNSWPAPTWRSTAKTGSIWPQFWPTSKRRPATPTRSHASCASYWRRRICACSMPPWCVPSRRQPRRRRCWSNRVG
jgi:hypothetical protein